jgi:hypothetical protein
MIMGRSQTNSKAVNFEPLPTRHYAIAVTAACFAVSKRKQSKAMSAEKLGRINAATRCSRKEGSQCLA